ncbi:NrfD/PsrC family molybdoenzyme membrane anchor subunit [Eggerthella guodeyinii]|uniref:Polysulfide reductase n=1 Tax=Eggerthella guodeyinii TaxID=2690837 RepID=A0A6N7RT69_9ACTN|nr:NrfD/PsrC family molybdoenzyme membrane anchor subunit [Eggerthella guodeyinii]MRX84040.1 polysulfide reductase [Eggerthella guodeyinii]
MSYEPVWGGIIAWYLFLAGLGGGAFVASAYLRWKHPEAVNMRRAGHLIAPAVVIVGLLLLMLDAEAGLHNPLRFALLLSNFGSVMSWGVVFLAGFTLVALAVAVLDILKKAVPKALEIAGVALGLCVAVYTGALLGVANTFPLWNNALLPILFLVSALSTGMAAVMLYGALARPDEFARVESLKRTHFALPLIELLLVASLLFITGFNSSAGSASVSSLLVGDYAFPFWIAFLAVGLVAPAAIEAWSMLGASDAFERSTQGRVAAAGSEIGVLVGGWVLRYLLIVAALPLVLVS